jgi:hypothetical protein
MLYYLNSRVIYQQVFNKPVKCLARCVYEGSKCSLPGVQEQGCNSKTMNVQCSDGQNRIAIRLNRNLNTY